VLTYEAPAFEIIRVEKNHIDNPIVRPGRLKVEM
jgi:hypothetical protein